MIAHTRSKTIGDLSVSVDYNGYPRWTRFVGPGISFSFDEEQVRDLHYALSRIISFLERAEKDDEARKTAA